MMSSPIFSSSNPLVDTKPTPTHLNTFQNMFLCVPQPQNRGGGYPHFPLNTHPVVGGGGGGEGGIAYKPYITTPLSP